MLNAEFRFQDVGVRRRIKHYKEGKDQISSIMVVVNI
jgi:hypothetical protein